jgi:CRP-like cAMP-binding protein
MLLAMAAELMLTPILMYSTRLVTLWDLVQTRMQSATVRSSPLLQGLSLWEARMVVLLGRLDSVPAGEFVVRKGERDTEMYMVVSRVRVSDRLVDGTEKVLAQLEPGAVFGEMALVSQEPRSASVVAETPAEVLRLDLEAFERIRRRFPFTGAKLFRNLARVLALRLRHTTAMLVEGHPPAVVPSATERA